MDDSDSASISRVFSSPGIPKTWVTPSFSRHSTISSAVERCLPMKTSLTSARPGRPAAVGQLPRAGARGEDVAMTADDVAAKQISELEARRYQAMTDGDTATLDELLSPDL